MSKEDLPEKVASYLNRHFSGEPHFEPYEIDRGETYHYSTMEDKELKWLIGARGWFMGCANIEEDVTEKIWILSGPITMLIDELLEAYGIRGFETRCKIVDELADRRNWDKCMKKFKRIVAELTWADDMAKRASQETGIEIVHFIPNSKFGGDDSFYYTSFDSKGMSDEEKMKEIERHVDAVDMAYKLLEDSEAERAFFEERFGIHRFGIRFHRRKKEKAKGTS